MFWNTILFKLIPRGFSDLIIRPIRIQIGINSSDLQEKLEIYTLTDKVVHKLIDNIPLKNPNFRSPIGLMLPFTYISIWLFDFSSSDVDCNTMAYFSDC